eukprot:413743-Lingulodinium_polyedra.AAC.1
MAAVNWTPRESRDFAQCGARVRQLEDGSLRLDQDSFCVNVEPIPTRRGRAQDEALQAWGHRELRGRL